jgi:hypothetical protein
MIRESCWSCMILARKSHESVYFEVAIGSLLVVVWSFVDYYLDMYMYLCTMV